MNKINVFLLSSLMLSGPSAFGMQFVKDLRTGVNAAKVRVKEVGDNSLPNRMVENTSDEIKGLNKDVKGLKKETDNIVNSVFELSETLASFGGYKQRYNSHISTLNKLKVSAKEGDQLDFDEADFKDLIDQEKAVLDKQQKTVPVVSRNGRGNVKQPVQRAVAVMPGYVAQLKRSVEAFNYAVDNHVNPRQPQQRVRVARGVAPVVNGRLSVADARKALDKTIDDFKGALENQREKICTKSTVGDFVYGGSGIRSWVTLGVVALGALYLGKSVKDSESGEKASVWFTQGSNAVKNVCNGIYDWIMAKMA